MTAPKTLADHAEAFATELTGTFRGVFGSTMPEFVAEASPRRDGTTQRLLVHPKDSVDLRLDIDGAHALTLICDYHCVWDHQLTYLKVTKANIHVRPANDTTPLFRYEFEDGMQAAFPCAHLQGPCAPRRVRVRDAASWQGEARHASQGRHRRVEVVIAPTVESALPARWTAHEAVRRGHSADADQRVCRDDGTESTNSD